MSSVPRKVLVVDDDPTIRDMMVDILTMEGYPTHVARNGQDALTLLSKGEPYVVLLDFMMPVMDGREFCRQLNALPELRKQHVIIMMSAMDKQEIAKSLNVDAILPKPFSVEEVLQVLQSYFP